MQKMLACILLFFCFGLQTAHSQTTTYILLRHAEKDTSAAGSAMMNADPPLSAQGEKRAQNLPSVLKDYQPDLIYTTNFTRTRNTVLPLAKKYQKEIQVYDPKILSVFAEQLLQIQGKTVVIAGHSNTTPALVNLLIKEKKYLALDESVYNQLWIVTLTAGKADVKQVSY